MMPSSPPDLHGRQRPPIDVRATLRRCARAVNSVFGRLALLAIALIVAIQVTWTIIVAQHQNDMEADHVSRLVRLAVASESTGNESGAALRKQLSNALGLRFVESDGVHPPFNCPNACAGSDSPFEKAMLRYLPPGSIVSLDPQRAEIWVHVAQTSGWIIVQGAVPSFWRLAGANAATLVIALCIALLGAWQVERPLLRLARAARQLRVGLRPPPVVVEGPSELKALTRDFNEMARAIMDADQERAVMLAGVAHDLRAPLTRIQVRASMVEAGELQTGFLQDSGSLSQIVTQFLDLARDADDHDAADWAQVDDFCKTRYAADADADADNGLGGDGVSDFGDSDKDRDNRRAPNQEPLILLQLHAGEYFTLPGIELDRILSNLIENAFAYGAPPLLIATKKEHGHYLLSIRDHGAGMPSTDFDRALRPFVRLDAARGGDAHCGLGLTIVRRLTRRYGGELALSNAPGGGLCVTLTFPDTDHRQTPRNFL